MRRLNLFAPDASAGRGGRVGAALAAEQIDARLYELDDGERGHPYHFHHGVEEWLLVVAGAPAVRTPDGKRALTPGDALCFPTGPSGAHEVMGPGTVLILSEKRAVDSVEYPERGEIAVHPPGKVFRSADALPGGQGA